MALRNAREMKLTSESREKCTSLLNRVEELLNAIMNAESTKKVIVAFKKEFKISFICNLSTIRLLCHVNSVDQFFDP